MKQLFIFIALFAHINFTMFIPHVDEIDVYDTSGSQIGDINTLGEYIDQVVLGNKHKATKDQDDDNAVYFHIVKVNYFFQQPTALLKIPSWDLTEKLKYPPYLEEKAAKQIFEIQCPPPEV